MKIDTVISLTTTPPRLPHIGPCIEKLKQQGFPIHLWIPRYYNRGAIEFDGNVPTFCQGVNVTVVEDQGPITKLLPALHLGCERIITADDDVLYLDGWADNLVVQSDKAIENAYCHVGRRVGPQTTYLKSRVFKQVAQVTEVNLVMGVGGVLYMNEFFGYSIHEEWKTYPLQDDMVISAHLIKRGVAMKVVPSKRVQTAGYMSIDPLWPKNRKTNDAILKALYWSEQ